MGWPDAMWLKKQLMGSGNQEITTNTVVTITQIPNNQYGFYIKLVDIDGETPLKDVVLNGVSDPNTELRTNANGELKFYSSKATHNVTWTNLPSHLSNDMFPSKLQGYINDLTSTIVELDTSNFYGYRITVKDNDGTILTNHQIYSNATGTTFKKTDSKGQIEFWSTSPNAPIAFAGKRKYYNSTVSSPTKGQMAEIEAKANATIYSGNATVGSTITFKGQQWIVAHVSGGKMYCSLTTISSNTKFGNNNIYAGSTLASVAKSFERSLDMNTLEQLLVPNTTVNGVTAKVFVASYEQMNGGWSYFNSDARRICKYGEYAEMYWTSSLFNTGLLWTVDSGGNLGGYSLRDTYGFRPSICLPV